MSETTDRRHGPGPGDGSSAGGPDRARYLGLERDADALAARLPELLVEAKRVSHTVAHGIHGRRRAGPGETFWQFRQLQPGDGREQVDWRRSASSDRLFVREREWEAAHTVWLWPDLSPSMVFCSHLARITKRDRALVITFALAELLAGGGERVGLLGLTGARLSRNIVQRLAEELLSQERRAEAPPSLPAEATVGPFSDCILLSDFLEPIDALAERLSRLAGQRAGGHLVQILDPAEETLPYAGRTEFLGLESEGSVLADKVETLRAAYGERMAAHRAGLGDLARALGWTLLVHHTDRPAEEPLLALYARLSGRLELAASSAPLAVGGAR
ncbi:MAG: DUF58 domain-containing protein [Rhizobiales bacterium]|nr:DUF58 domain-containing protein [Hyphomicrobiales bacterium]